MSGMSRRDLLQASAGAAAVAVPMSALSAGGVAAAAAPQPASPIAVADEAALTRGRLAGPVMFCVHDAATGEVSILHGADEVVVRDRQLVARILHAAARRAV